MSSLREAFTNLTPTSTKPIVKENDRTIPDEMQHSRDTTTTTFHQPYGTSNRVIQDNNVQFELQNNHSWSNSRGYGNLVIGTFDSCNNIHGRVHPWNRIRPLNSKRDPSKLSN
tara:strand:+ start:2884 stop:3222 length:339 start_codon:yes stop_codon:yes gene_type:complete